MSHWTSEPSEAEEDDMAKIERSEVTLSRITLSLNGEEHRSLARQLEEEKFADTVVVSITETEDGHSVISVRAGW